MPTQTFNTADVLRLEVETDPAGIVNLVQNPNGELGGWGWVTPASGSAMTGDGSKLTYSGGAGASWFTTEAMPVTVGHYVAARWEVVSGTAGHFYRARFEWLDSDGAVLSSSTQTGYLAASTAAVSNYGPHQAPASAAYVRLRFDLFSNNTGTNPTGAHTMSLQRVTVASAATSGELGSLRTNLVANPSFESSTAQWTVTGPQVVRTNLMSNPSFETSTAGWVAGAGTAMLVRDPADGAVGSASLSAFSADDGSPAARIYVAAPVVTVTAGQSYVLSAMMRGDATSCTGGVLVRWYNTGGTQVGADQFVSQSFTNVWARRTAVVTAPVGATGLRIYWYMNKPAATYPAGFAYNLMLDGVIVEQAAAFVDYFDGSTADAGGWDYAWTGTAHTSTSTATKAGVVASTTSPAGVPAGSKALAITLDAAAGSGVATATNAAASVTAGRAYSAQVRVMSPAAVDCRITITWRNASNAVIGAISGVTTALAANTWTMLTVSGTAPATATTATVSIEFDTPGAGAVHYADAAMLEASLTPGTYFDGNTPDAGGVDYAWAGTVNESQSTATTSNLEYVAPVEYLNVLPESHELRTTRQGLTAGTLAGTILSSTLDPAQATLIRPGRRTRLTVYTGGTWQPVFTGKLNEATVRYELKDPAVPDEKRARIEILAVDAAQQLANTQRPEGVATIDELPFVLEGAGVPWSVNGSGDQVPTANVTTVNENASALSQVALTRDTALGYAWVDRSGILQVADSAHMPPAAGTLDEADYSELDLSFSTTDCINEVMVTVQSIGAGGETVETVYGPYRDAASIAEWGQFRKDFTVTGLAAAQVDSLAAAILAANGTPRVRVNSITIPIRHASELDHALRDLYDLVTVVNATKGVSDALRITSIENQIETQRWLMRVSFTDDGAVAVPKTQPPVQSGVRPDVGVIELFAGPTSKIPAGKLLCNGQSVAVADYPYLHAVIGYTFGGSGASFNVPNLVDRFPIGAGTKALGSSGGAATKTIAEANLPPHTHSLPTRDSATGFGTAPTVAVSNTGGTVTTRTSGNGSFANTPLDVMNPWLSINYVIRAV